MVKSMLHERFYGCGSLLESNSGVGVGWVCLQAAFDDCQPIWNENKDICLVFSGEHYAGSTEPESVKAAGHECPGGNATYLVHLYEELGKTFFKTLNGNFSGVVIDLRENKVILFNDRFGLHRIYYHESEDAFHFASEAKALLQAFPQLRQVDMQSWGESFGCGCTLQNRTLFDGVSLLPPGSLWTFRPGQRIQKELYFQKSDWEGFAQLPTEDYYQRLKETFVRILPRYFKGRQPVALSLTGGLDSRMIIAVAPFLPFKLQTYTFGGMVRECADVKVARKVALACQQYHEVLVMHRKFFNEFPSLARRCVQISDGTMDVSGAVGLFMNRMARDLAPVRLTGNYGSEILRGHVAFKPAALCGQMFDGQFLPWVLKAADTYACEREAVVPASFIAFKQVPWHHYGLNALEQSQLLIRSPYLDNEIVPLSYQMPHDAAVNRALLHRLIVESNPALSGVPTDRGAMERLSIMPYKLRVLLEEFFPRAEYVYDYGMPQWLARIDRYTSPLHIDRLFLGRQKYRHFRIWYRDQLSSYVKEVLLDPQTLGRPYLNGRFVGKMVTAHVTGRGNYTSEIHKLLTTEMIERHLLGQP